eukprot:CAMPEP_0173124268 /NCGR_PEP_ID=MMETSP1102-20130122/55533_1 /TAXON_ID=49646 /ORGANISM="Geminigera sp., Strain Caron Lab Isolate" /LENGTH=206 /DNA_ID=CAMNT_0014032539 /DNA_START=24 /DNA_END=644 /DNA_ORIENTATION=+
MGCAAAAEREEKATSPTNQSPNLHPKGVTQWAARQLLKEKKRPLRQQTSRPTSIQKESHNATRNSQMDDIEGNGDEHLSASTQLHAGNAKSPASTVKHSPSGTFLSHHILTSWAHDSMRESGREHKDRKQKRESFEREGVSPSRPYALRIPSQASPSSPNASRREGNSLNVSRQGAESSGGRSHGTPGKLPGRPIGARWMPSSLRD